MLTKFGIIYISQTFNMHIETNSAENFSLHHRVQTDFVAHPASYPMGTSGSIPGSKAAGEWSWSLTSI
jgi:hypothetical protein